MSQSHLGQLDLGSHLCMLAFFVSTGFFVPNPKALSLDPRNRRLCLRELLRSLLAGLWPQPRTKIEERGSDDPSTTAYILLLSQQCICIYVYVL